MRFSIVVSLSLAVAGASAQESAPAAETCYYELEWQLVAGGNSRFEKIGVAKGQTLTAEQVWQAYVAGAGRPLPAEARAVNVTGPVCVPAAQEEPPPIVVPPPTAPPPNPCAVLEGWIPTLPGAGQTTTNPTGGENAGDWFGAPGEVIDQIRRACNPPAGQNANQAPRRSAERDGLVRIQMPDGRATYARISQLRVQPRPGIAFVVDTADGPPTAFVPATGGTCEGTAGGGGRAALGEPHAAGSFTVVTAQPDVQRLQSIRLTRPDGTVLQFGSAGRTIRR